MKRMGSFGESLTVVLPQGHFAPIGILSEESFPTSTHIDDLPLPSEDHWEALLFV